MTLADLLNAQQIAGARYQAAVNELHESYVSLAALDAVLSNRGVNDSHGEVRTFFPLQADLRPFDHSVFAPLKLPCDWRETIAQRRDTIIAAFTCQTEKEVSDD